MTEVMKSLSTSTGSATIPLFIKLYTLVFGDLASTQNASQMDKLMSDPAVLGKLIEQLQQRDLRLDQVAKLCHLLLRMLHAVEQNVPSHSSTETLAKVNEAIQAILLQLGCTEDHVRHKSRMSGTNRRKNYGKTHSIFNVLLKMCLKWPFSIPSMLQSPQFMKLFAGENLEFFNELVQFLRQCVLRHGKPFLQQSSLQKQAILDELFHCLSITNSQSTLLNIVNCLLAILDVDSSLRKLLPARYPTAKNVLTQWLDKLEQKQVVGEVLRGQTQATGADSLKEMLLQLTELYKSTTVPGRSARAGDAPVEARPEALLHRAAVVIQTAWRGYYARKRWNQFVSTLTSMQGNVRSRLRRSQRKRDTDTKEAESRHLNTLDRQRSQRERLESEFRLLADLPLPLVAQVEEEKQTAAAVRIQTLFRGYRTRRWLRRHAVSMRRRRAACTIQRYYRSYIFAKKRRLLRLVEEEKLRILLDDDGSEYTIERLQQKHIGWCELNSPKTKTRQELEVLHNEIQNKLGDFHVHQTWMQREINSIQASLASMALDVNLLLVEPSKAVVSEDGKSRIGPLDLVAQRRQCPGGEGSRWLDVSDLLSPFSLPEASQLARHQHTACTAQFNCPWWRVAMRMWNRSCSDWYAAVKDGANEECRVPNREAFDDFIDQLVTDGSCGHPPHDKISH